MNPMDCALLLLLVCTGFYTAWNIGANDVANAMGTSVGSGALSLKRAVWIAACLEFFGAFFFGSHVSKTIQSGLIDPDFFANQPYLLVYGMLASLGAAGVWLHVASYLGQPVSTTHSIVGALVGFGLVAGGWEAIYWTNIGQIALSWILSPLLGGLTGYYLFSFLRKHIFYALDPLKAMYRLTPLLVFLVSTVLAAIAIFEGLYHLHRDFSMIWSLAAVLGLALASTLVAWWYCTSASKKLRFEESHAEYAKVESLFSYLQIVSACMMAFAHGANDVANAIGPLSAAVEVMRSGVVSLENAIVPSWALALGGAGIVVGLATWGWRVIETIGKKITELTPSRGFAAEFSTALTILLASRLGMPVSTTHTLVGAVIGVGFARGLESVNLITMREIMISWLVTVPVGAGIAVALYYPIQWVFR